MQNITFRFDEINFSAQVGDIIYYTYNTGFTGGFDNANLSDTRRLGRIVEIQERTGVPLGTRDRFQITVRYDETKTSAPAGRCFISFVKDKTINTSSLLGYYANVKLVNDSTSKVELFSIGSEVTESSK